MRGPIDYIVVGFEGKKFDGSIILTLADPIEKGIIRLVALTAIRKGSDGVVQLLDVADVGDEYLVKFIEANPVEAADQDDVNEVGELLENDTSAGLLIVEQLWALPLKQAIINANGVLVAEGRIHPDAALELK